jgi:site-specific DNA-methyltransferase (adenine-specific)
MSAPTVTTLKPYYADDAITLYHGDFREVLANLVGQRFDAVVTDPPYGETRLEWDQWVHGWPAAVAPFTNAMWCFGSLRMFFKNLPEFSGWNFSQDVVWEKHNGSGILPDRFRRVHEHATFWYQGPWSEIHHTTPTTPDASARTVRRSSTPAHWQGDRGASSYRSEEGGSRLMRSVIYARSMHGRSINETEKPSAVVEPLVEYSVPRGGVVLDVFAGSGSTGLAARVQGRRAVLIEKREQQCEQAAQRFAQFTFDVNDKAGNP